MGIFGVRIMVTLLDNKCIKAEWLDKIWEKQRNTVEINLSKYKTWIEYKEKLKIEEYVKIYVNDMYMLSPVWWKVRTVSQ